MVNRGHFKTIVTSLAEIKVDYQDQFQQREEETNFHSEFSQIDYSKIVIGVFYSFTISGGYFST